MRRRIIVAGIIGITVILAGAIFSLFHTYQAVSFLKQGSIVQASHQAKLAKWFPQIASTITFHSQPDIEAWQLSLSIIGQLDRVTDTSKNYLKTALNKGSNNNTPQVLRAQLLNLSRDIDHFQTAYQHSWILKRAIANKNLPTALKLAQQSLTIGQKLLTGHHTYLFLLQNSQELRATGGFMGSYALVTIDDGTITRLDIQDIYTADGQFTGFVEPPAGVKEYLSSGNGMRLPDANWSPDFPTSARQILSFFSLSNEKNIEGVVAVNLPAIESLLRVTGSITIPDYQTTVTADNFATVARSDRSQFFPGSQQKQHFMSSFFNQLLINLQQLKTDQYSKLFSSLSESAHQKNVLFFSQDPEIDDVFEQLGITGSIMLRHDTNFYFYSIESNVGINKANKNIERAVSLNLTEDTSTATMVLTNANTPPTAEDLKNLAPTEAKHLGYIDYQRILVPVPFKVSSITINSQAILKWDEEIITTTYGNKLKQIGFLVTVPEQQQSIVQVSFTHPNLPRSPNIQIDKQPGISAPTYQVQYHDHQKQWSLDSDSYFSL